jgi:hypothetical protein
MESMLLENLEKIRRAPSEEGGMDIVVVSCTTPGQERYWQSRLEEGRGQVLNADALAVAVFEDWEGGAGNGLGTLYALEKANARAGELYGVNLFEQVQSGKSLALYHTAGKGTRLAPLPASEHNNKPGVKLPGLVQLPGGAMPLTILEAVILQTALYAPSRSGRISVFWGDQVFIPSAPVDYEPRHHADLLARVGPMPRSDEWTERGLDKYGLLVINAEGDAVQIEKVGYDAVHDLAEQGVLDFAGGIGVSLGSFSVSLPLARALAAEFREELDRKRGKFDTDPHFWMPLTLPNTTYVELMERKGEASEKAETHHERMQSFREKFLTEYPELGLLGSVDVGEKAYWWDYGQLPLFWKNNRKLLEYDAEGAAMRTFFNIPASHVTGAVAAGLEIDSESIVLGCKLGRGSVRKSVLVDVVADNIQADYSVAIAVRAPEVNLISALVYNVRTEAPLIMEKAQVRADVSIQGRAPVVLKTELSRDGGKDWYETLPGNEFSYDAVHKMNQTLE